MVVPAYNARATIERCLLALEGQVGAPTFETIVVDSSGDGTAELVRARFPRVRLERSTERRFPGDARNAGVRLARSSVIAFTDADCIPAPDWVARIAALHRQESAAAIGGAVANGNPSSLVGWAYYLTEFGQWLPGRSAGAMVEVPTCCLSVKREVLAQVGPFLEGTYCSDTVFSWRLARAAGQRPLFEPSLVVEHVNVDRLGRFLRHEPQHGRAFARVRVTEQRLSRARRTAHVLATPVLPVILFARTVGRVSASAVPLRRLLLVSPLVLAGLAAWSWGELRGYLDRPDSVAA